MFVVHRLARFLETAGSVLNYFEPFLGRIEIMGGSKRIERVYFEIKESNIEQWEKPQIKVFYLHSKCSICCNIIASQLIIGTLPFFFLRNQSVPSFTPLSQKEVIKKNWKPLLISVRMLYLKCSMQVVLWQSMMVVAQEAVKLAKLLTAIWQMKMRNG